MTTSYTYDTLDDLITVTQGGQTRSFTYDSLKQLRSATNPEVGPVISCGNLTVNVSECYSYDANGNLSSKAAFGVTTSFNYDALDRIATNGTTHGKSYSDTTPFVDYTYDTVQKGCLDSVSNSVATTTFTAYNPSCEVTASRETVSAQNYNFSYAYNLASKLTQETYPSGRIVSYHYDAAGRADRVANGQLSSQSSYASGIGYYPWGAISSMTLGVTSTNPGWTETWQYNNRLQPTSVNVGSGGGGLLNIAFYYCPSGGATCTTNNGNMLREVTTRSGTAWTQDYTASGYDAMNRLISAQETGGPLYTYGYDRYGNRWQVSPTPPTLETPQTADWYVSSCPGVTSTSCNRINAWTYDGRGNVSSIWSMPRTFSYDGENRQTSATINGTGTTYSYDGEGRRIMKTVGGMTTTFVYDVFGHLIAEYGGQNSSGTQYFNVDHLGSTRLVTDASGAAVQCHDYLPFGEEIVSGTNGRGSCFPAAPSAGVEFTSKERDAETGLDFFEARYMSSAQGRFTSPDPAGLLAAKPGNPQSWNLYAYGMNNPLVNIDPNGLDCVNATDNQGGFTVNHDTNSGACGKSGGTWVPGYVNEKWVDYNNGTGLYQVGSMDGAGKNATVDYAMFAAGAETNDKGKCLSGCGGYGFASANADWLQGQLVGSSKAGGLDGYIQFLTGREQPLSGGLLNKLASGPLDPSTDHWAGPGGMGPPGGRGDWAASVHDYNYSTNGPSPGQGITIGMYFNPTISPATAKALIQSNNVLIRNAGGVQGAKMGLFFGAVNAFQWASHLGR